MGLLYMRYSTLLMGKFELSFIELQSFREGTNARKTDMSKIEGR